MSCCSTASKSMPFRAPKGRTMNARICSMLSSHFCSSHSKNTECLGILLLVDLAQPGGVLGLHQRFSVDDELVLILWRRHGPEPDEFPLERLGCLTILQ